MPDYGPTRDETGKRIGRLAPEVDIADRPDPDRPDRGRTPPTVRGARRHDAVLVIYGDKSPQLRAADRFRDDCALATGARVDGLRAAFRVSSSGRYPEPSSAMLDAIDRERAAWQAIGQVGVRITRHCILGGMSCRMYDRTFHARHGGAARRLARALDLLIAHYETLDNPGSLMAGRGHATSSATEPRPCR